MPRARPPSAASLAVALLLAFGGTRAASAESAITLPPPDLLGGIDADTYDETGQRVGDAEISFTRLESGHFLLRGLSGIEGSARSEVQAEFEPVAGGDRLRLVRQQSQAHDESGQSLGVMTIDHREGVAVCGVPDGSPDEPVRVELPGRTGW